MKKLILFLLLLAIAPTSIAQSMEKSIFNQIVCDDMSAYLKNMLDSAPKNKFGVRRIDYGDWDNTRDHYWITCDQRGTYILSHLNEDDKSNNEYSVYIETSELLVEGEGFITDSNSQKGLLEKVLKLPHKELWRIKEW